jgi:hypothetical protein
VHRASEPGIHRVDLPRIDDALLLGAGADRHEEDQVRVDEVAEVVVQRSLADADALARQGAVQPVDAERTGVGGEERPHEVAQRRDVLHAMALHHVAEA